MFETYQMLGQEHEADLARDAERLHRADPFRRRLNRMIRARALWRLDSRSSTGTSANCCTPTARTNSWERSTGAIHMGLTRSARR
jgi:hypothetical protein